MRSWRAWDEVAGAENLWQAWREFERGKRGRPDVAEFSLRAEGHVFALERELAAGRYQPGPYRLIRVNDPKRRLVAAAPVRDRVVHHAVHRVLSPLLDRRFIEHSYACLPGRGSHRALLTFAERLRTYRFALQLDVRRYFYSVDRAVLSSILLPHFSETELRGLLTVLLESGGDLYRPAWVADWLGWDAPGEPGRGLPIGNLTSQWWGNFYLDGLDHFACRALRVPAYQRYMDDITVFADDRSRLLEARDRIADWLSVERRLALKDPAAAPIHGAAGADYLGYRVTRAGFALGPKARGRLRERLALASGDPERVEAVVASYAGAWMFGSPACAPKSSE